MVASDTELNGNSETHQSILDSSSRELTQQLLELEKLQTDSILAHNVLLTDRQGHKQFRQVSARNRVTQPTRRLAPVKQALVADDVGRRAAAGDDCLVEQRSITSVGIVHLNSGRNSARGERSQKRGNNVA